MELSGKCGIAVSGAFAICLFSTTGCTAPRAARTNLEDLQKLAQKPDVNHEKSEDETFVKDIGFSDLKELENAQVGSPLRLYNVSLVELQQFQTGDDPKKLLHDTHRLVFPLMVKGEYRSSFTAMENSFQIGMKPWLSARVTRAGFPRLIRKIEQLKQKNPNSPDPSLTDPSSTEDPISLVLVAPLRLLLLGDVKAERLVLTVVDDNQHLKLKSGEQRDAEQLFSKLAPGAKQLYERDQQFRGRAQGREGLTDAGMQGTPQRR